jgi:arginase
MLGLPGTVAEVAGIGPRTPLLAASDVVLLAADPSQTKPAEREAIESNGVAVVPMAEAIADPAGAAARALAMLDHEVLLVHFDVDVVDFVDLPLSENTGHNIGMPFATARKVLAAACADPRVAALTVTEHNPLHGADDGSTTAALAEALVGAFG